MRPRNQLKLSVGAFALAMGIAGIALAQGPQGGPPPGGPGIMRGGAQLSPEQREERRAEMRQRMEARQEERSKLMHDALGIQPNQENAWNAWREAMKPPAPPAPPAQNAAPMTTQQRLDQQLARSNTRAAEVKKRIDATKKFYAALTPTQQKSFDALQQLQREPRGGMRDGARQRFGDGPRGGDIGRGFGPPPG